MLNILEMGGVVYFISFLWVGISDFLLFVENERKKIEYRNFQKIY